MSADVGHGAEFDALDIIEGLVLRRVLNIGRLQETPEFERGYKAALNDVRAYIQGRRQRVIPSDAS